MDDAIEKTHAVIDQVQVVKKGLMQELLTRGLPGRHKKFKKTEIGEVPEEWDVRRLVEVAQFRSGKAHEPFVDDAGPFVVVNSKFISTEGKVRKHCTQALTLLAAGEVAMVMSDIPNGRAIAKCFLVPENDLFALNQRICGLTARGINNVFLYYVLNRSSYFLGFDNGVGQTNLRKKEVLDCPLRIPPPEEQEQIVGILTGIDATLRKHDAACRQLQTVKHGLMSVLLTGELRVTVDESETV